MKTSKLNKPTLNKARARHQMTKYVSSTLSQFVTTHLLLWQLPVLHDATIPGSCSSCCHYCCFHCTSTALGAVGKRSAGPVSCASSATTPAAPVVTTVAVTVPSSGLGALGKHCFLSHLGQNVWGLDGIVQLTTVNWEVTACCIAVLNWADPNMLQFKVPFKLVTVVLLLAKW